MKRPEEGRKQERISEMRTDRIRYLAYRVTAEDGTAWNVVYALGDNRIREVFRERCGAPAAGDIYLGRVVQTAGNISASFVETEGGRFFLPGILPQDALLPVMVETIAYREKLAKATTTLSVNGTYMTLSMGRGGLFFSKKLTAAEKERLRNFWVSDAVCRLLEGKEVQILFRTKAGDADDEVLCRELSGLLAALDGVLERAAVEKRCVKLLESSSVIKKTVAMAAEEEALWITPSRELYEAAAAEASAAGYPAGLVRLYEDTDISAATLYGIRQKLKNILSEKVWLPSGAGLVITETEAMCVIDVNSAGVRLKKDREGLFLQINLEAAAEIAAQIVARNLSGTILVDFISMQNAESETILLSGMRELTRGIYPPVRVVDITKLGIMEITRQRREGSISEIGDLLDRTILL